MESINDLKQFDWHKNVSIIHRILHNFINANFTMCSNANIYGNICGLMVKS